MRPITKQLYTFLSSCGGNWRNTIYVYDPAHFGDGLLMAFDRDAHPVVMQVDQLRQISGEDIDPSECRSSLDKSAFEDIFAQFLLWRQTSAEDDPLATGDSGS